MAVYDIGTNPLDITGLITYSGSGENDGSEKKLGDFKKANRPMLLVFINTYVPATFMGTEGREWLRSLMVAKDSTFDMYVVMCKRDAIGWVACDEMADVIPTLDFVSPTNRDAAFSGIPVVIDGTNGAVSSLWLGGIIGVPTAFNAWTYIIDRANLISDKWDTACRASHCHISFKHFKPPAVTTDFDGGDYSKAAAYARQRIDNLNAALRILYAVPAAGSWINSASAITKVALSRPIQDITNASLGCFPLTGDGVRNPPILPDSFGYTYWDKVENTIPFVYPAGGLADAGSEDVVRLTLDPACIKDTDGTPIAAADNTVVYNADVLRPRPVIYAPGVGGTTVDHAQVSIVVDFGEPLASGESLRKEHMTPPPAGTTIGAISTNLVNQVFSFTMTLVQDQPTSVSVLSDKVHDRAGNPNEASNTLSLTFADSCPSCVNSICGRGEIQVTGDWIKKIDAMLSHFKFCIPTLRYCPGKVGGSCPNIDPVRDFTWLEEIEKIVILNQGRMTAKKIMKLPQFRSALSKLPKDLARRVVKMSERIAKDRK